MLQIYGIFLLTHPLNNTFDKTHCLVYCKEQSLPFRCLSRTKKYGVRIFHVSMHVKCQPRLSWLKCFSLTFSILPWLLQIKHTMTSLGESEMQRNSEIVLVECEHIFFSTKLAMAAATLALNLEMRNMNLYVPDSTTSLLKRYLCFLTYFQFKWYYLKGFYRGNVI